jgi:subtilisin family serine protease
MSFGGSVSYTALTDQINAAYYQNKIIMVAAAGNGFGAPVLWPARLDAVIAVSATDFNNSLASFSNTGLEVELTAPGEGIVTTCLGGGVCSVDGTSFAAPHVAAAAALLRGYNSRWSNVEVRRRLAVGATDLGAAGRDTHFGYGLLNTLASVTAPAAIAPAAGILGPSSVKPNVTCMWSATASGGVPPYTYKWLVNYGHVGNGQYLSYQNSGAQSSLLIELTVTGADFGQKSVSTTVCVNSGAPVCAN